MSNSRPQLRNKNFPCLMPQCRQFFSNEAEVRQHFIDAHAHPNDHPCHICYNDPDRENVAFSHQEALNQHMRHTHQLSPMPGPRALMPLIRNTRDLKDGQTESSKTNFSWLQRFLPTASVPNRIPWPKVIPTGPNAARGDLYLELYLTNYCTGTRSVDQLDQPVSRTAAPIACTYGCSKQFQDIDEALVHRHREHGVVGLLNCWCSLCSPFSGVDDNAQQLSDQQLEWDRTQIQPMPDLNDLDQVENWLAAQPASNNTDVSLGRYDPANMAAGFPGWYDPAISPTTPTPATPLLGPADPNVITQSPWPFPIGKEDEKGIQLDHEDAQTNEEVPQASGEDFQMEDEDSQMEDEESQMEDGDSQMDDVSDAVDQVYAGIFESESEPGEDEGSEYDPMDED